MRPMPTALLPLLLASCALAGEYVLPLSRSTPTLDGRIEEAEWSSATRLDGFGWQGLLEQRRASGWVLAGEEALYLAIRSQLPTEGEIVSECTRSSENLVFDDSIEAWVEPTPDAERGARYQMLANSLGYAWYRKHPRGGEPEDVGWRGEWQLQCSLHDGSWDAEIAVPWADIARGRELEGLTFALNLCRNFKQEWAFCSLGGGDYAPADRFTVRREPGLVCGLQQRDDPFDGKVRSVLTLRNESAAPLSATASLALERDVMPPLREERTLTLEAGATAEVTLAVEDASTTRHTLHAHVADAAGGTLLDRSISWKRLGPLTWTTHKREIAPVDFQFAYYPSRNKLRILADTANLPPGARLERLEGVVRAKGGPEVRAFTFEHLVGGREELSLELPPLEGRYEIALRATGEGVPVQEVVKEFVRDRFEWEGTQLGRSETVYPPFTPIEVAGRTVGTVLREHEMADGGLWSQVRARERPLLAGPMRWESDAEVAAGAPAFSLTRPDRAVAASSLRIGGVEGTVTSTWDVDGTMRVDLTLPPGASPLQRLDLVIPLRAEEATHLHAMGDGIRNTVSTRLPEGAGVVWDSLGTAANDLPRGFASYVYLGTPVRGLCWFAENDRDWGWMPGTPNVEIARVEGRVELRVHLINRPTVRDRERTITFGLLAAPVKPRIPEDWRHRWRRERYSLLGTDINWLALGDCGSVYPAGRDLSLWEAIARGNREQLSEGEIAKVVERVMPYFEPYGADKLAAAQAHARYNLTARYGTRMVYYYNRASYQAAEEFRTFQDEWSLTDWRTVPEGNGVGEIKIVPSDSYIDHALWWYAKSFEVGGNQGVYWDNWFFVGDYNTEMTGAYRREDGATVPSTGIWGLRELCRRTFQMMNERGMPPITMPHMTSTNILPLHSFATVQYDWEWKYSEGDVQGRFPRDYILLVSNGELAGTWPVLLGDHGPQAEDPWVARTFAACALVHELDCGYPGWSEVGRQQLALLAPVDEMLADARTRAWRYWDDEPPPAVADRADLPTIVYAVHGERALVGVVSYADEDVTAVVRLDAERLGLAGDLAVSDAETGEELPAAGGVVSFPLARHDIRLLWVRAR